MKEILFFDVDNKTEKQLFEFKFEDYRTMFFTTSISDTCLNDIDLKKVELISVFVFSQLNCCNLSKFPNLKAIITRSVGLNHIDMQYCDKNKIKVFNAPDYGDDTVAEFTFASMLTCVRNIIAANSDLKNNKIDMQKYTGLELKGKTIGILGFGSIGKKVAKIANGFSMNVITYDINPPQTEEFVKFVDFQTLCKNSDFLTLNLPLNDKTYHMFNKQCFNMMKDSSVIINTSRGEIIETEALYANLKTKKLLYCALDVLECEEIACNRCFGSRMECLKFDCLKKSMINKKIINMPNVVVTPHIAFATKEAIERISQITLENFKTFFSNGTKNLINSETFKN